MENEPENKPLRKRPKGAAFLFAGVGLFLFDGTADSLALHKAGMLAWLLVITGTGLLLLAVLWGTRRI
jgi:hypothetical protein